MISIAKEPAVDRLNITWSLKIKKNTLLENDSHTAKEQHEIETTVKIWKP